MPPWYRVEESLDFLESHLASRHCKLDLEVSGTIASTSASERVCHMSGCQNSGPFLGPRYNTAPNI